MIRNIVTIMEPTMFKCTMGTCDWKVHIVAPMALDIAVNMVWRHWADAHGYWPEGEPDDQSQGV